MGVTAPAERAVRVSTAPDSRVPRAEQATHVELPSLFLKRTGQREEEVVAPKGKMNPTLDNNDISVSDPFSHLVFITL